MITINKTKGIVVKTVKYGDTSIIASIYTELFGMQSFIIKGARKTSKKGNSQTNYFLPSTLLELSFHNNEFKNLQFIKDYHLSTLYQTISYNVIKNAVAMFCLELLHHSIKQPENNPELFYFIEECFLELDKVDDNTIVANFPLYFSLKLAEQLGFGIMNNFSENQSILDLQQGVFVSEVPLQPSFINNNLAKITSSILNFSNLKKLSEVQLNQNIRRQLLDAYIQYYALHVNSFTKMQSIEVLREVL